MDTHPNSEIVPFWKGRLIPDVWLDVQKGLAKERARLAGSRWVTAVLQRSFDIEGLTEWIYLGRGFADLPLAEEHIRDQLQRCVGLYVHSRGFNANPPWRELPEPAHVRWPNIDLWPSVGPVQRVKWGDGTGFNSEEYHGAAFEVNPQEPLSNRLLEAIGQETELVRLLQGVANSR